jgi:hypothetical protein
MYAVSTTVRIREDAKEALDRLQARMTLEMGERPSLQEVLDRVLEVAEAHEEELVLADEPPNLTEEERERILSTGFSTGRGTREEDIDDVLYGSPEGPE